MLCPGYAAETLSFEDDAPCLHFVRKKGTPITEMTKYGQEFSYEQQHQKDHNNYQRWQ